MTSVRYILVLSIVLVIFVLTWLYSKSLVPKDVLPADDQRHIPDYFVSDFSATVYDSRGQPYYKLRANQIEHFPDDSTAALSFPEMTILRENRRPWHATADNGTADENEDTVTLRGNVVITREADSEDQKFVVKTADIQIDLTDKTATTNAEVHITGNRSTISAKGMKLNLENGTLVTSNAKGTYVPH